MTVYPKLTEVEFDRLPEPFKAMIQWDERRPQVPDVIDIRDIPSKLEELKDWNETKDRIRIGCQAVIKKQRGSGGGASSG